MFKCLIKPRLENEFDLKTTTIITATLEMHIYKNDKLIHVIVFYQSQSIEELLTAYNDFIANYEDPIDDPIDIDLSDVEDPDDIAF